MTNNDLDKIRESFFECMDSVYNTSCRSDFDDGDMMSHQGWIRDDDNLKDLCASFGEWVAQLSHNNS